MKFLILISFFVVTLFSTELDKVSLQLKWKYQFQFAGFIVAKEMGFYKDVGLDVELKEFENGIDIIKDVSSGEMDFGLSDSSLIYRALKGESVSAIMAILQQTPFVLMSLKKSLNKNSCKRVALQGENTDSVTVKIMLKANNIDYVKVPPVFKLDKLISGEIDMMLAYVSNEPYIMKQKNIDVVLSHPKDYGFDEYGDILFSSKEMIQKHPKRVKKMYDATYKGWGYAFSHIEEVVDLIYEKYNTLNKTKDALRYEANILKKLSGYGKNFGELDREKIKHTAKLFNLLKEEKNSIDILDDFTYSRDSKDTILTKQEREWLNKNHTVRVRVANTLPLQSNKDGKFSGISVDYIKKIFEKHSIKYKFISSKSILGKKH